MNAPVPDLKLATWNVNGIRARQGEVQQWIERERPDVVCLQEIRMKLSSPSLGMGGACAVG